MFFLRSWGVSPPPGRLLPALLDVDVVRRAERLRGFLGDLPDDADAQAGAREGMPGTQGFSALHVKRDVSCPEEERK